MAGPSASATDMLRMSCVVTNKQMFRRPGSRNKYVCDASHRQDTQIGRGRSTRRRLSSLRVRGQPVQARQSDHFSSVVAVLELRTASFCGIAHIVDYKDREGRHTLPLLLAQRLIERLPSLGELVQIGGSLSQCFGALLQEGDRVAIADGFDPALVSPHTHGFLDFRDTGSAILRPGANGALDRWPKLFLIRCQLQCGLHQIDSHVGYCIPVRCIQLFRSGSRRRRRSSLRVRDWGSSEEECTCSGRYDFEHGDLLGELPPGAAQNGCVLRNRVDLDQRTVAVTSRCVVELAPLNVSDESRR